jgi:hypothetical protein
MPILSHNQVSNFTKSLRKKIRLCKADSPHIKNAKKKVFSPFRPGYPELKQRAAFAFAG